MALFPDLLGLGFQTLDPCLRRVHGGESRRLRGRVTVERGTAVPANILAALASLPPSMHDAPLAVELQVAGQTEIWTRWFGEEHRMVSTLRRDGAWLVERLGPCALAFRLAPRAGGLQWELARLAILGVPLPLRWFDIGATIDGRDGRYQVRVHAGLRHWGEVVRYEGWLDAAT